MGQTVVVGMSGGVDSSVAALLLKEAGYEVMGVTMDLWREESREELARQGGCCGLSAVEDARRVAQILGIPHYVLNFRAAFREKVVDDFAAEYLRGRTPNPCIACNRHLKWGALLRRSVELGADYIATGHYAQVGRLANGRWAVRTATARAKDQSYVLYPLTQEQLSRTLLPLGGYTKEQVRALAAQASLPVARKPDSQDLCFVPDGDYAGFLAREVPEKLPGPGNFVNARGETLGRHKGIVHYTVGQGRGLGIALGRRVYVTRIRPETNEVVLGEDDETYAQTLDCDGLNFMGLADLARPRRLWAKVRYAHPGAWCTAVRDCQRSGLAASLTMFFCGPLQRTPRPQGRPGRTFAGRDVFFPTYTPPEKIFYAPFAPGGAKLCETF